MKYPHPVWSVYLMYPSVGGATQGSNMAHIDFGSDYMSTIGNFGPVVLGAAIGAELGSLFPVIGTTVGAIVGAFVGAFLAYAQGAVFEDEAQTMWFWVDNQFTTALLNIPIYLWLGGLAAVSIWLAAQLHELRVGNTWIMNAYGYTGP